MWCAPGMRIDLCWETTANPAEARNAPKPGSEVAHHCFDLTQTNPNERVAYGVIVMALQRRNELCAPTLVHFRLQRLIRHHTRRPGQKDSLHLARVAPPLDSTCSLTANLQRASFAECRGQRLGRFDPCRRFMVQLNVASFLCLMAAGGAAQAQVAQAYSHAIVQAASTTVAQRFDAAQMAQYRDHWPEAYAELSALADEGHPEAARMAMQMRQHYPALYGRELVASAGQVAQWKRRWRCGSDVTVAGCQQALAAP